MPIYIILLAVSIDIGYLIALTTKSTVITIDGFSFSWVPVLIIMYLIFVISGILKKTIESFTIFYTSLTRLMEIITSIKDEITNYLLMQKSDSESQNTPLQKSQYIDQLAEYTEQYEKNQIFRAADRSVSLI